MKNIDIQNYIDHTLLKNTATEEQIISLCNEAILYHFKSVCVNPTHVSLAKKTLQDTDIEICTVIGFPLGANTIATKAFETKDAIANGATEIDMVINIGKAKEGNFAYITQEIAAVVEAANGVLVKVIIETCDLTPEEIRACSQCVINAKAQFVKTSTGFSNGGATLEDVKAMHDVVKDHALVKASGGIRDLETALQMIDAGAQRLGTSAGVKMMIPNTNDTKDATNSSY